MAVESILIVDDAPVNLKLADILLRKEGYQVQTAPDAEEALRLLRDFLPKVMLVDIQLPGIDGLELTRRVRQDPRTRDMTVIALTGHTAKVDEDRALVAGCDGYITKPIDTKTLGSRIRECVDRRTKPKPASAAPLPLDLPLSDVELESVRRRFLEQGVLQCRQLLMDLNSQFDAEKALHLVHHWIGAGGALGYTDITAYAQLLEGLLSSTKLDIKVLRDALSELAHAFGEPPEARLDPLPESVIAAVAGKRIALVGFAPEEAERLCAVFQQLGGLPRLFEADEPADSEFIGLCQAVMVHVRRQTLQTGLLAPDCSTTPSGPLLYVGSRALIMALDPKVQARAREFLIDAWQPEEALLRLALSFVRQASTAPGFRG